MPTPLKFRVSTYPTGASQIGSTGAGESSGRPENIDFYVIIRAKVIAKKNEIPKNVQFILKRGSETQYEAGYLITSTTSSDAPVPKGGNTFEWTYRTSGQRSKTSRLNWNVTKLKGRYSISVQNYTSTTVQFKIDKRSQIVFVARAYNGAPRLYKVGKSTLFSYCFGFAGHIYTQVGLKIRGDTSTMYKDATAPDRGKGSLRFFSVSSHETKPAAFHPAPSHVAIVDGDRQIDNNNGVDGAGPTIRPLDTGVGSVYSAGPKRPPYSRTLPYPGQANSLLQGLDNE